MYSATGDPGSWVKADTSTYTIEIDQSSSSASDATLNLTFSQGGQYKIQPIVTASFGADSCCQGQARPVVLCAVNAAPTIAIVRTGTWTTKVNNIFRPSPANTCQFTATITPNTLMRKIRFILVGTSSETGTNCNTGTGTALDLTFENQAGFDNPAGTKQEIVTSAAVNSVTVTVTAQDYGPYGKIKAKIDGTAVESTQISVLTDASPAGGNNVEDAWDTAFPAPTGGTLAGDDDKDNLPAIGTDNGDLLQRYEEYRGFTVRKEDNSADLYVSTDPAKKTVFLRDKTGWTITDGGGSTLSLFKKLGADTYWVVAGQTDATTRKINFNAKNTQRAVWVESDDGTNTGGAWGTTTGGTPSTYTSVYVYVAQFSQKLKLETALTAAATAAVIYTAASETDGSLKDSWQANGFVKIDNEVIKYTTGWPPMTKETDVATARIQVPADSTSIIVDGVRSMSFVRIQDEIVQIQVKYNGVTGNTIKACNAAATEIELKTGQYANPGGSYYLYAKLDTGGNTEWIRFTGYDTTTSKFTGVTRGVLGTAAKAHAEDCNMDIYAQFPNSKRGQLGTTAAAIPTGKTLYPIGVLKDLTRGQKSTAAAPHVVNADIPWFVNPNDAIRETSAHEAGHACGLDHANTYQIMNRILLRGAVLTNGLYDDYSAAEKAGFTAR